MMPEVEGRRAFLAAKDLGGSPEQVTTHWKPPLINICKTPKKWGGKNNP